MNKRNFALIILCFLFTSSFLSAAQDVSPKLLIIDQIGKFSPIDTTKGASTALLPKNYSLSLTGGRIHNGLSYLFSMNQIKNMPLFGYIFNSNHAFAKEK